MCGGEFLITWEVVQPFSQPARHILPDRPIEADRKHLELVFHTVPFLLNACWAQLVVCFSSGSVNENQRPSNSYNGDLNGLLVPDPLGSGDGPALAKPVHRSSSLAALQEKQVM